MDYLIDLEISWWSEWTSWTLKSLLICWFVHLNLWPHNLLNVYWRIRHIYISLLLILSLIHWFGLLSLRALVLRIICQHNWNIFIFQWCSVCHWQMKLTIAICTLYVVTAMFSITAYKDCFEVFYSSHVIFRPNSSILYC